MEKNLFVVLVPFVTQTTAIVLWSTKYSERCNIFSVGQSLREFYSKRKLRFSIHSPLILTTHAQGNYSKTSTIYSAKMQILSVVRTCGASMCPAWVVPTAIIQNLTMSFRFTTATNS